MKKNSNHWWLLAVLCIGYVFHAEAKEPVPARRMDFSEALDLTFRNSHVLKQAEYLRAQKAQEARATKGLYFPNIGIIAEYVEMSDPVHLDLTPVKDAIVPLYQTLSQYGKFGDIPGLSDDVATQMIRGKLTQGLAGIENGQWDEMIQKKQFGTVAATFQWPLFAGGKIRAANKAATIDRTDADDITRQKEGEVITELVERYYGLNLAQQAVMVRLEVLKGLQQHLDDAGKMESEGLIAHAEVLHARVFHEQAVRELSKARQTAEILEQALQSTLVLEDSIPIDPVSDLFYLDTLAPETHYIDLAKKNNPSLNEVDTKQKLSIQNYHAQRAEFFPTVAIQGTYNIANKDLSPYAPDWIVGVGLKWTLFDWTTRFNKAKAASLRTKQVEEVREKASSDVSTLVDKLYHELKMYHEQLTELEAALSYAEEYLDVREKEFHQEMSNSTEVVDARLALANVRIERLQVLYSYDLTLAKLLETTGTPREFTVYAHQPSVHTEHFH